MTQVKTLTKNFRIKKSDYFMEPRVFCILSKLNSEYDVNSIGKLLYPNGCETIDPFSEHDFGILELTKSEEMDGLVTIPNIKKKLGTASVKVISSAFEDFCSGYFEYLPGTDTLVQLSINDFLVKLGGDNFDIAHFVNFEAWETD